MLAAREPQRGSVMRKFACLAVILLLGTLLGGQPPAPAQAQTAPPAQPREEVDVALVLAVDISYSMDLDELALQRTGYIEAMRSPEVLKAIQNGATGRIAVIYFEWAGFNIQHLLVPWTVIDGPERANAFADELQRQPIRRGQRTSIAGAIDFSLRQFDEMPFRALRQVIDISGDGPNNSGRSVTAARDEAVGRGIAINGLPISIKTPGYLDIADLDLYYEDCVIGGRNAFVIPIKERSQFAQAIRTKLIMEISDAAPDPARLIRKAQNRGRPHCLIGEEMFRNRMGN